MPSVGPIQPDPSAPGSHFRHLILAELASRDHTRQWLAEGVEHLPGSPSSAANIYAYLRGDSDTTGEIIHAMFTVLDLRVTRY